MLDMFKRKFSIGGYNFDDWSLVKELYVPENVSSSTAKSLHMRGREDWPHHLQHYVIPNDKKFIVFAVTNVEMTTTSGMGLFGTGLGYGRYPISCQQPGEANPGAPIAWSPTSYHLYGEENRDYYANQPTFGFLVLYEGIVFECRQTHWPTTDADKRPSLDGDTVWWYKGSTWNINWKDNTWYFFNEIELVEVEGLVGSYFCMVDHTSSASTKPCDGVDWDYGGGGKWNPGDEYMSDFGLKHRYLSVSEGTDKPFGSEILAVMSGASATLGRRIDAKTTTGTMEAGATLLGIEVVA